MGTPVRVAPLESAFKWRKFEMEKIEIKKKKKIYTKTQTVIVLSLRRSQPPQGGFGR